VRKKRILQLVWDSKVSENLLPTVNSRATNFQGVAGRAPGQPEAAQGVRELHRGCRQSRAQRAPQRYASCVFRKSK
jgi:hypothetical protein